MGYILENDLVFPLKGLKGPGCLKLFLKASPIYKL